MSLFFLSLDFAVRMALSTSPFAWGNLGELVTCVKWYAAANCRKASALYYGPLSDIMTSGMPCVAKTCLSAFMTECEVSSGSSTMTNHLE